ncbi:MAG: c-type cytochrome [Flavobacteriales bacterium]|nr:c-type cytochrome [Flavobacteriales bacterium]MBK7943328.1 c-type cytochrome [Flavobacteriales bacterium]MBK8947971.1 c-type cytochrome [Flavobacteriales bacterium]
MKRVLRTLGIFLVVSVVVMVGAITYITQALPDIDAPVDLKVEATAARIERGAYLANSVCACMDCHSTRDWSKLSGPLIPGSLGAGGERFDEKLGFPGTFISPNVTPFALAEWSDGELYRAITSGVSKNGRALFPVMPYLNYGSMDPEDVYSIIAYLRSLPAVESSPAPSEPAFPMNIIIHTMPAVGTAGARPDGSDPVALGRYIANAAGCAECHTRSEKGQKVGPEFAGGFEFRLPSGSVLRSPNITPSEKGGIGTWSREQFIKRFNEAADSAYVPPLVDASKGDFQTVMPWMMYAGMTGSDLGALYDYLRTVEPVDATVERWSPH